MGVTTVQFKTKDVPEHTEVNWQLIQEQHCENTKGCGDDICSNCLFFIDNEAEFKEWFKLKINA